jgi:predicted negative regulator of RcsB-dependent stress response
MPLDLEEQEQLANLKAFWVNYGRWLSLGILIALIGYSAFRFYQKYQENISLDAAKEYEELIVASSKSDFPLVVKKAEEIERNLLVLPMHRWLV